MKVHISKVKVLKLSIQEMIDCLHDEIEYNCFDDDTLYMYEELKRIQNSIPTAPTTAYIEIDVNKEFESVLIDLYEQFVDIVTSVPKLLD